VALYSSVLRPTGARYEVLEPCPLIDAVSIGEGKPGG
jgi:hypothetical protein